MLKQGDRGSAVQAAQVGIAADLQIVLVCDGVFGPNTTAAVKQFQTKHGLTADGIIGPATQNCIPRTVRGFTQPVQAFSPAFPRDNYGLRTGAPPSMIVVHHSDTGSATVTKRVLTGRGLSTHYEVDRDGTVFEYLDPAKFVAWHCGGGVNSRSIGIDITHHGDQAFTPEQVKAASELLHYLCGMFGIPPVVAPDTGMCDRDAHNRAIVPAGYGIFRHRNICNTECPADFPMEAAVAL